MLVALVEKTRLVGFVDRCGRVVDVEFIEDAFAVCIHTALFAIITAQNFTSGGFWSSYSNWARACVSLDGLISCSML